MIDHIQINDDLELSGADEDSISSWVHWLNDQEIFDNTLMIPRPYTREEGERFLRTIQKFETEHDQRSFWNILFRNEIIGAISLLYQDGLESHRSEIGYWIARDYRNRGIMTTVLQFFTEYCFVHYDLIRLEAKVYDNNNASRKVLVKSGFAEEGFQKKYFKKKNRYLDVWSYAIIHPDFR